MRPRGVTNDGEPEALKSLPKDVPTIVRGIMQGIGGERFQSCPWRKS